MSLSIQTNIVMPKYQIAFKGKERMVKKTDSFFKVSNKKNIPVVKLETKINAFIEKALNKLFPEAGL